jgi:hypothetical protein
MKKIEVGQRVEDDYLGSGVVTEVVYGHIKDVFAYMIKFDTTPPLDYNRGSNPCLRFAGSLEVIK